MIFRFQNALDMSLPFDLATPFIPGWGWIYIGSFAFWIYLYTTVAQDSPEAAYKLSIADCVGKLISLVFFLALPTTNVRPEVEGSSLTALLMRIIYAMDTPTNLFPSIHCFIVWLGTRYIFSCKNLKRKSLHCFISLCGTLLVFASTLFTKQHVVLDVFGGIAAAEIGWLIATFSPLSNILQKWNERFMKTKLCNQYL